MFDYVTTPDHAESFLEWINSRGGVAVWYSVDLSDPGYSLFTPALTPEGEPTPKPSWKVSNIPSDVCTDPEKIGIVIYQPADRFKVAVRRSSNGLKLKLTDASSERLRKRLNKAREKVANEWEQWVTYRFDYETQQAVILVPTGLAPLSDYA